MKVYLVRFNKQMCFSIVVQFWKIRILWLLQGKEHCRHIAKLQRQRKEWIVLPRSSKFNKYANRNVSRMLRNFFLTEQTLRESNLNISLVLHVCAYIPSTCATRFVISTASIAHAIRFIYHENIAPGSFISTIFKERKIPPRLLILSTLPYFRLAFLVSFRILRPVVLFGHTLSRATLQAVHVSAITARNSFPF